MKKFFTLIALFAISTCAVMAQNQILNGGFEDWGVDKGNTPKVEKLFLPRFQNHATGIHSVVHQVVGLLQQAIIASSVRMPIAVSIVLV